MTPRQPGKEPNALVTQEDGPRCSTFTADINQIRRFLRMSYGCPFFGSSLNKSIQAILPPGKGPNEDILSETDPPAWVEEMLEYPVYYDLLAHLHKLYPSNKVLNYFHKLCILKSRGKNRRDDNNELVAEASSALAIETVRMFGDNARLARYCTDFIPSYHPLPEETPETFDMGCFPSRLEAVTHIEAKRHTILGDIYVGEEEIDLEFVACLHQALSKPLLSRGLIFKLWETCINHPTPAEIMAARNTSLLDSLIDYVFILNQPKPDGLNPTKNMALNLISCLANSNREGKHKDLRVIPVYTRKLKEFYLTLALYFKEMLFEFNSDKCCILTARIFIKYVHYYVKKSRYYESFMNPTNTPLLHNHLIRLANRFNTLSPPILYCLFECLKATNITKGYLIIGKHVVSEIIDQIVSFFALGLEELVIHIFNKNLSFLDVSDLTYTIEKVHFHLPQPQP
ncbi:hypothetical protein DSO57_1031830 [Entomophthora muscae]|uniref:Uncharacterized protein n=1 Tax=Entomophthora muscae TaxID=34485 RepID=A0ACC2RF79_9FUNG|nr:hypothetical protein DSO57_1031830 [Entomophthora muscae]